MALPIRRVELFFYHQIFSSFLEILDATSV
jgi:hypothetical protein